VRARVKLCDNAAGGLLACRWDDRVDQGCARGESQQTCEPQSKPAVFKIGLINAAGMLQKQFADHVGLQDDPDTPLDSISETVHLSRNACWRRIRLMQDGGIILGKSIKLNAEALGLPLTVFIQVRTDQHDRAWAVQFAAATRALPHITGVYRMSGDLDYLIRAQVADMSDYDRLYQNLTSKVAIADVSASFVMEAIKDTPALPL